MDGEATGAATTPAAILKGMNGPTPAEPPRGSRGVAIATALLSLGFWVVLPALIAVGAYISLTVYAIVKAVGAAPDGGNPVVVLLIVVGGVALFALAFGASISLIGRAADPKKRRY
jgi:predicted Co/Zn/Cd cation transporter (cation efflux family)